MRKTIIYMTFVAAMLTLGSCSDKPTVGPEPADTRHDIYYTVSGESDFAVFSGTTVHVDTETEWDALLDQFCEYAADGEKVVFCSLTTQPTAKAKGSKSDVPTQITTADRDELKTWMKEMEKAGKTVHVTYDDGSGTWNGRAYANLGQHEPQAEPQEYSGTIDFVATPVLDNPPLGGVVMALQTGQATYVITVHGMILWFDDEADDDVRRLLRGTQASFTGIVASHTALDGSTFLYIDLEVPDSGIIEF